MIRQTVPAVQLAQVKNSDSLFTRLGVQRLPIEEQSMFKLLLLLPLGAAVVVFMRVIIGLKTSGTFMPVLIALAFLQTSLVAGPDQLCPDCCHRPGAAQLPVATQSAVGVAYRHADRAW